MFPVIFFISVLLLKIISFHLFSSCIMKIYLIIFEAKASNFQEPSCQYENRSSAFKTQVFSDQVLYFTIIVSFEILESFS